MKDHKNDIKEFISANRCWVLDKKSLAGLVEMLPESSAARSATDETKFIRVLDTYERGDFLVYNKKKKEDFFSKQHRIGIPLYHAGERVAPEDPQNWHMTVVETEDGPYVGWHRQTTVHSHPPSKEELLANLNMTKEALDNHRPYTEDWDAVDSIAYSQLSMGCKVNKRFYDSFLERVDVKIDPSFEKMITDIRRPPPCKKWWEDRFLGRTIKEIVWSTNDREEKIERLILDDGTDLKVSNNLFYTTLEKENT